MVEWKKLGDVARLIRGKVISKDYIRDFEGDYPVYSSQTANDGVLGYINSYMFDGDYLTWTTDGAYAGTIFSRKGKFSITNVCGLIDITDNNVQQNYLYFWLSKTAKDYVLDGMGNPKLMSNVASTIPIPIPSLSEQNRIVGILDTFTASIENLKEQIAQRRKQYEYYRDQLLDLEGKEGVEMKTISEVAKNFTGLTYKPEFLSETGTLVLRSSNIDEDKLVFVDNVYVQMDIPPRAIVEENDILICVRNGSKRLVGKAAMITKDAEGMAFGAFMTILRCFDINSKFLFFVWQSTKVKMQYKGDEAMPIAQITAKDFQRIIIPVPPISEQQRIVSILDTFEASIQNLEAQLSQREKQYEYYRNKLLTFD
jgi:type I restriction enzyme S subunit